MYKGVILILFSINVGLAQDFEWPDSKVFHSVGEETFNQSIKLLEHFPKWAGNDEQKLKGKDFQNFRYMYSRAVNYLRFHPKFDMTEDRIKEIQKVVIKFPEYNSYYGLLSISKFEELEKLLLEHHKNKKLSDYYFHDYLIRFKDYELNNSDFLRFLLSAFENNSFKKYKYKYGFQLIPLAIKTQKIGVAETVLKLMSQDKEITSKYKYELIYFQAEIARIKGDLRTAVKLFKQISKEYPIEKEKNDFGRIRDVGDVEVLANKVLKYFSRVQRGHYKPGAWYLPTGNYDAFVYGGVTARDILKPAVRKSFDKVLGEYWDVRFISRDDWPKKDLMGLIDNHPTEILEQMLELTFNEPTHREREIAYEVIRRLANKQNSELILKYYEKDPHLVNLAFLADEEKALEILRRKVHYFGGKGGVPFYVKEKILEHEVESAYVLIAEGCLEIHGHVADDLTSLYSKLKPNSSKYFHALMDLTIQEVMELLAKETLKNPSFWDNNYKMTAELLFKYGYKNGLEILVECSEKAENDPLHISSESLLKILKEHLPKTYNTANIKAAVASAKRARWNKALLKWQ